MGSVDRHLTLLGREFTPFQSIEIVMARPNANFIIEPRQDGTPTASTHVPHGTSNLIG